MKETLMPWERGLVFRRGELCREIGPGEHRIRRHERLERVDTRVRSEAQAAQDVPASDGVLLRVTLVLRWSVVDATAYVVTAENPYGEIYLATQVALRRAVATRTHDRVDAERDAVAAEVLAGTKPVAGRVGVEISEVSVRDVVLPAELRRAAVAELVARAEGRAALERARAETAALRSLLNAARLAEEHPALLRLRTLQVAGEGGGTVVLERPA
ncbi:slipin family protein [Longimycelium tulufanense]|uniref:slipin family protein n=1 Tax=Longimycelium tulufanense TaxID=907463 RepID=UPI00166BD207|nr:slipin family protein [Longimycelium tulufanense]